MSNSDQLQVGHLVARPGEVVKGRLSVGTFADGTEITIPVILLHGAKPGPVVYVQAGAHGIELNPMEALRGALVQLDPAEMAGSVIAVPVANPWSLNLRMRQNPFDLEDINRLYPGRPTGSMSDRLVHAAYEHCVKQADYVIDLHTTDGTTLPHIRMGQSPVEQELARVFGIPYLVDERHDAVLKRARFDGKLRVVATNDGKPAITPELGGNRRLQREIAAMGSRGILNVLKHLKVLDGSPQLPDKQIVVSYDSTGVLHTNQGGYYITAVEFGQHVIAGEVIGRLYDLATFDQIAEFTAPFDGVVLSTTEDPARHTGDRLAMICRLEREVVNETSP